MVFRHRKKNTALLSVLLATAILLQSLFFPVHTAHATGEGGDDPAPGSSPVPIDSAEPECPAPTACLYETQSLPCKYCGRGTDSAELNSVAITWGSMSFVYRNSAWEPISKDGDLITVTNLSETATMRATIRYNPSTSTQGIADIMANLVSIKADPNAAEDTLYPHHNIAATAAKLDVSPPSATPAADEHNTLTARLQLTGEPTEELDYAPLGTVTITISKPQTEISTWGHKHDNSENPLAAVQIYWVIRLDGSANSKIPGSTLKNELLPAVDSAMGDHRYAHDDIAAGITVGASHLDANGQEIGWYQWIVDTDQLTWSLVGDTPYWSYTIPQTIPGSSIPLGSKGWIYYINYTSTTQEKATPGIVGYMNRATLTENPDDPLTRVSHVSEGWVSMEHSEAHGNIVPFGSIADGYYTWEVNAIIPGLQAGNEADYFWYVMDYLEVFDGYDRVGYVENILGNYDKTGYDRGGYGGTVIDAAELTNVTATYLNGEKTEVTKVVPSIEFATDEDFCAWHDHWSAETTVGGSTIAYGKHLDILCRCYCTAETCPFWGTHGCGTIYHGDASEEFCQCWTAPESVTFTFSYKTEMAPILQAYGNGNGSGGHYNLVNKAELWRSAEETPDNWTGILVDILDVAIAIEKPTTSSETPGESP